MVERKKLIVLGLLVAIFVFALYVRMIPADYGELNEYDPFFNYRITGFLIDNGFEEFKNWHDYKTWYPEGRDISRTSQEGLIFTTAFLYNVFYSEGDLYEFVIIIPAIFGALIVFPLYGVVFQLTKSHRTGLITVLFFSFALQVFLRTSAGWFKSEPLGILYALSALCIFIYAYNQQSLKKALPFALIGGVIYSLGIGSWTGATIFLIPIMLIGLVYPIVSRDTKHIGLTLLVFAFGLVVTIPLFDRAFALFMPLVGMITMIAVYCIVSKLIEKRVIKIVIMGSVVSLVSGVIIFSEIVTTRFKNVLFPYLSLGDADNLMMSVSEHTFLSANQYFYGQGFLLIFGALGIFFILKLKNFQSKNMILLLLLVGVTMYFGFSVARLQIVLSIGLIVLSAITITRLTDYLLVSKHPTRNLTILGMIILATIIPFTVAWAEIMEIPPTILSGAISIVPYYDWIDAMSFLEELDDDTNVFAWWDYGYIITSTSNVNTYMDNGALNSEKIEKYAKIFTMSPEKAHDELLKLDADYVLISSTTIKHNTGYSSYYTIGTGGDDTKSGWIFTIAGIDLKSIDDKRFHESLLGSMLPYKIVAIGGSKVVVLEDKFSSDNEELFQLVYESPSIRDDRNGVRLGILIYEVIK